VEWLGVAGVIRAGVVIGIATYVVAPLAANVSNARAEVKLMKPSTKARA
jgi:hypothetical protein